MKAPFFSVFIEGNSRRDLSEWIESFRYERAVDRDDMLEISIKSSFSATLDQAEDVKNGMTLVFQYGYKAGAVSTFHKAKVVDINYRYAERVIIKLRCLDKGTVMRKDPSGKIWKNVTTGEVVRQMADKYGLTAVVEAEGRTWASFAQGNMTDMEFIQHLSQQDNSGNFIVYITDEEIHMESRGTGKKSSYLFTYQDPESGWISFEPKQQDSTAKAMGTKAEAHAGIDPATGKIKAATVVQGTEKKSQVALGDYILEYDAQGNFVKKQQMGAVQASQAATAQFSEPVGKRALLPGSTDGEAVIDAANGMKKKGHEQASYATLKIVGTPALKLNEVITLANLFERHNGNYLIRAITDDVGMGGYTTTISLDKSAGKKKTTKKATAGVNKTVGPETGKQNTAKVYKFDANGKPVK